MDLFIIRSVFIVLVTVTCWFLHPFGLKGWPAVAAGVLMGVVIVGFEMRLRIVSLKRDRKSTRLNSSHMPKSRMPSSA